MTLRGAEGTLQMAARGIVRGETILGCQTGPSVLAGVRVSGRWEGPRCWLWTWTP